MNENLNLVEILKDCPQGVEFEYIKYNKIFTTDKRGFTRVFTQNGAWDCTNADVDECLSSKDQRDWSKFNIEPKFNISTLQPFDKVLVRDYSDNNWCCGFFSHIGNYLYKFICIGSAYNQCIPYNDETKHLVGTTKMPPKKYITWEE